MKPALLLLSLLSLSLLSFSQPAPDSLWFHVYDDWFAGSAQNIIPSFDGGYILTGQQWTILDTNNVYLDLVVSGIDAAGEMEWAIQLLGNPELGWQPASLCRTADSAYFVLGRKRYGGNADILLMKISRTGDSLWSREYRFHEFQYAYSIEPTPDGSYIIASSAAVTDTAWGCGLQTLLMKITPDGDSLWTRYFYSHCDDAPLFATPTSDGGFLIPRHCWFEPATPFTLYVTKTDAEGNEEWTWPWPGVGDGIPCGIIETADGFVMGGTRGNEAGFRTPFLLKFDAQGNQQWLHDYDNGNWIETSCGLLQDTDGGFVIAGSAVRVDADRHPLTLVKADAEGNFVWRAMSGTGARDYANGVCATSDGGWIIAGLNDATTNGSPGHPLLAKFGFTSTSSPLEAARLETIALYPNYPNPFNPATEIAFDLPRTTQVSLSVYDILGQQISTLANGVLPGGYHVVYFDGSDLPSGMYFCKLIAPGTTQTRKMVLMK